jgi:hypothetical protein
MLEECSSAKQVADLLRVAGITGDTNSYYRCPLAFYLSVVDWDTGILDNIAHFAPYRYGDEEIWAKLSESAQDFISEFDAGNFPELVKQRLTL